MKKIILFLLVPLSIYIIYNKYSKQSELVLSFGNIDAEYNYKYNNTRITDLITDIKSNKKINNRNIQNLLVKASYIYIDLNELINCNSYHNALINIKDFEDFIILIRKYSKEQIEIKLLLEKSDIDEYINQKLMVYLEKYDIIFMRWKNDRRS